MQNFTGFYILIHAHDFITFSFCQDYWGWKYLTFSFFLFLDIIFSDMVHFLKKDHFSCFKFRLLWQKCLRRKPCRSCKGQIKAAAFFWTDKTAHGMKALIFCQKHEKNGIFRKIISEKLDAKVRKVKDEYLTQSEETKTKKWLVCMPDRDGQKCKKKKFLQMRLNFNWASFFLFYMFNIQLTTNFRTFFRMQDKVSLLHKLYIISVPKRNFFLLRLRTSWV